MHLDDGDADGADAVGQGDGGVGIAARVHHYGIVLSVGLLQLVNQNAFVVGLELRNLVLWKTLAELHKILFKGEASVDFRFALAQKVKVRAVENEDFHQQIFVAKIMFLGT